MPLANVVEGEANPLRTVCGEDLREYVVVANALVFGDLEHDAGGFASGAAEEEEQLIDAVDRVEQRSRADIEEERAPIG